MEAVAFWIGFAASVGTLLQLSEEVIKYINDAKDALAERRRLLNEIIAIKEVLRLLEARAKRDDWKPTMSALNAPYGPLDEFKGVLESLKKKLQPARTTAGIIARSMTWYFSKDKTKDMISVVERFKLLFNLVLTNENLCRFPTLIC